MNNVTVRPATPADAEAVWYLKRDSWLDTYPNLELGITVEHLRRRLEGEHGEKIQPGIERIRGQIEAAGERSRYFVAERDGRIIGVTSPFIGAHGRRRIGSLYLLPDAIGHGAGHQLLEANLDWHGRTHDIYLYVASYNTRAIQFYERHGFRFTDTPVYDDAAGPDDIPIPEREMLRRATA